MLSFEEPDCALFFLADHHVDLTEGVIQGFKCTGMASTYYSNVITFFVQKNCPAKNCLGAGLARPADGPEAILSSGRNFAPTHNFPNNLPPRFSLIFQYSSGIGEGGGGAQIGNKMTGFDRASRRPFWSVGSDGAKWLPNRAFHNKQIKLIWSRVETGILADLP